MGVDRAKIVAHAEAYWWRPCKDGVVWNASEPLRIADLAKKEGLTDHGGAFLWYGPRSLEGLFLLPNAKIDAAKNGNFADFPEAVMMCSYLDHPAEEAAIIKGLKLKKPPPYFGLNDCTHFTSECLIQGGFAVTDDKARRGAGELYDYLYWSGGTKVLALDVSQGDATNVIDAGLLKQGDVIVYRNQKDKLRHHGVVYVGDGGIAMHTFHQWKSDWKTSGGGEQLYSLFHLSHDDVFVGDIATRWVGWWQVKEGSAVRYYYIGENGRLHAQAAKPLSTKTKPAGDSYCFADSTSLKICVRLKGDVEQLTWTAPAAGAAPAVTGKRLSTKAVLNATKLP